MTVFTPICSYCTHFNAGVRDREVCQAFPNGIPQEILDGRSDHHVSVTGDHGITFDPAEGFDYWNEPTVAGDIFGHDFHGNQWTQGKGGEAIKAELEKQQSLHEAQTSPLAHPAHISGMSQYQIAGTRYVGAYGEEFTTKPLPDDVEQGEPNQCYKNASLCVMTHPELTYAEGFAYPNDKQTALGLLHAWAVDKDGNVVDPSPLPHPETWRYFGVKYDRAKYLKYLYTSKLYGVLGSTEKNAKKAITTGGKALR